MLRVTVISAVLILAALITLKVMGFFMGKIIVITGLVLLIAAIYWWLKKNY